MCSSSTNSTMSPAALTSSITFLRRSSNSPRYLVLARSMPSWSDITRLFLSLSGTSPSTMSCASPSAIAVFPTPGSPTRHGLDLRRLTRMRSTRSTSESRPSTGSNFPARASAVRSTPHSASALPFFFFPSFLPAPTSSFFSPLISLRIAATSQSRSSTSKPCAPQVWSAIIASASSLVPTMASPAEASASVETRSNSLLTSAESGMSPSATLPPFLKGFMSSSSLTPARRPHALRMASSVPPSLCMAADVSFLCLASARSKCSVLISDRRSRLASSMPSFTAVTASPSNRSNIARGETRGARLDRRRLTRDDATRDAARRGADRSRAPGAM
mmetsp:Transcript_9250/g.37352  ORF Transcript_9250/g.37352 Transcript_9250/m.37352 type:complete len:332 (-) Transcript_9250:101-1096(-)